MSQNGHATNPKFDTAHPAPTIENAPSAKRPKVETKDDADVVPVSITAEQNNTMTDGQVPVKSRFPVSTGIRVESSALPPESSKLGESPPLLKTYCQHDVSIPADAPSAYDFSSLKLPDPLAKEYQFNLDAFQRESIKCLERNESVLVAAHTSAGKTVVAEYAIALALRNKQRVIYTSPIKALSNQKYRELSAEFKDVGLMTGDVTIDKNASCLVMTTEILRSMLYRGSEVVREVAWVIFDEVHYMRDRERGVVWEETIILVAPNVRFVFLSATIPNAREFSEWIAHLKNQPCHTIYTDTRPVPLQHYLYPEGGKGLHLIVTDKGQFKTEAFERAVTEVGSLAATKASPAVARRLKGRANSGPGKSEVFKVVEMIKEKDFYPVIVFSFSRRDCETFAMQLSKIDFIDDEEREFVKKVFDNAISALNEEDQQLPQITAILPLLLRGIGIHHSGLLPIIKEIVEILFCEGLLKCLFATETFSMGVNMPARTVLFTGIRKFDGTAKRLLFTGEYVQMSGRAGRRGLDARGTAILMCDEKIEPKTAKELMSGKAEPLKSTFRLGYNMLLNLMRAEEADPEYVIARSLAQFQGDRKVPHLEAKMVQLETERDDIRLGGPEIGVGEQQVHNYFKLRDHAEKLRAEVRDAIHQPAYVVPFLRAGRLTRVHVARDDQDFGWGAVIDCKKKEKSAFKQEDEERYSVHVLLRCTAGSNAKGQRPKPFVPPANGQSPDTKGPRTRRKGIAEDTQEEWIVVDCSLRDLHGLSALRVMKPIDLRPVEARASVGRAVVEVLRRFPDGPPMLDPFVDMGITDEKLAILLRKVEAVEEAMTNSPVSTSPHMRTLMKQWAKREEVNDKVKEVKKEVKAAKGLILVEDLKRMKRVLRRLGFSNAEGIVEVKGRVACEVNTADELVITELLLGGNLNEMSAEVLVSLCSCFVLDEGKKDEKLQLEKVLSSAYETLQTVCTRVATVKKESGLVIDVEEYVQSFSPNAMQVVYAWMQGKSFAEVCALSELFEGSVVRCFRRLEELLRQLVAAVKSIGNTELEEKFEKGSSLLKRGIAFQSSLYI